MKFKFFNTVLFSFSILILFFACTDDDQVIENVQHVKPVFVAELNPVDDEGVSTNISNNVIQGIASFENGWFVTQKTGTSVLLINYLNASGESLFHTRLPIASHGQDLSLEQISENELYLYTTKGAFDDNRNTGILKLKVTLSGLTNNERDWNLTDIQVLSDYNLNYTNCTPTLSENKEQFAIRSAQTILVHKKNDIEQLNFDSQYNFQLDTEQTLDNGGYSMYFQGIVMKNDLVYCLTGNSRIGTHKSIFAYNQLGVITKKNIFDRTDLNQIFFDKFEPEGLTILNDKIFFCIMTKSQTKDGNIKYLYSLPL